MFIIFQKSNLEVSFADSQVAYISLTLAASGQNYSFDFDNSSQFDLVVAESTVVGEYISEQQPCEILDLSGETVRPLKKTNLSGCKTTLTTHLCRLITDPIPHSRYISRKAFGKFRGRRLRDLSFDSSRLDSSVDVQIDLDTTSKRHDQSIDITLSKVDFMKFSQMTN